MDKNSAKPAMPICLSTPPQTPVIGSRSALDTLSSFANPGSPLVAPYVDPYHDLQNSHNFLSRIWYTVEFKAIISNQCAQQVRR